MIPASKEVGTLIQIIIPCSIRASTVASLHLLEGPSCRAMTCSLSLQRPWWVCLPRTLNPLMSQETREAWWQQGVSQGRDHYRSSIHISNNNNTISTNNYAHHRLPRVRHPEKRWEDRKEERTSLDAPKTVNSLHCKAELGSKNLVPRDHSLRGTGPAVSRHHQQTSSSNFRVPRMTWAWQAMNYWWVQLLCNLNWQPITWASDNRNSRDITTLRP